MDAMCFWADAGNGTYMEKAESYGKALVITTLIQSLGTFFIVSLVSYQRFRHRDASAYGSAG